MAIVPEEVSKGVGDIGRKYGIAPLPEIWPDMAIIAARKRREADSAQRARLAQVAMDAAETLTATLRKLEELGGEVELPSDQAATVLNSLDEANEAIKPLIAKIKNYGLLRVTRGGVA